MESGILRLTIHVFFLFALLMEFLKVGVHSFGFNLQTRDRFNVPCPVSGCLLRGGRREGQGQDRSRARDDPRGGRGRKHSCWRSEANDEGQDDI